MGREIPTAETALAAESKRAPVFSGDAFEIGYQHGLAFAKEINDFLEDGVARVRHVTRNALDHSEILKKAREYAGSIRDSSPQLHEEMRGLSEGARISLDSAALLQSRREIIGFKTVPQYGDCSTLASNDRPSYIAQTVDLPGNMSTLA